MYDLRLVSYKLSVELFKPASVSSSTTTTMVSSKSIIASLHFICLTLSSALQRFERLSLPSRVYGPESLAFDLSGMGPYTGVSDGRILKFQGQGKGWMDFAVTSARREKSCDGSLSTSMESVCGRPLGLQFSRATTELYIADAYYGLVAIGQSGGVAWQMATEAEGEPFCFLNGLDIDQETGVVYFTDSSTRYQRKDYMWILNTGDATGRLIKYNPWNKEITVLLRGLAFPNGVTLSKDRSFLLVTETTTCRVLRYWLRGPAAGTSHTFRDLPGNPDNIKMTTKGEFWVVVNQITHQRCNHPFWALDMVSFRDKQKSSIALKLGEEGRVLEFFNPKFLVSASEANEYNASLWFGSVVVPYVGVYKI